MTEFAQIKEINDRHKKRFQLIRKPNLKELSDSYRKISTLLSPFPNYSGYCSYLSAKCEHQIVGALKDQLNQHESSPTLSTNSFHSENRNKKTLLNLTNEAIWREFQTWLDTARIFTQKDGQSLDDEWISAYAHAMQTCPSSSMLSMIANEFANNYVLNNRFYEAAEIYMKGGFFHNAIHCLMRGNFYQDAYHCYQEMIVSSLNYENYNHLADKVYLGTRDSLRNSSHIYDQSNDRTKSSLLSIFKRKDNKSRFYSQQLKNLPQSEKSIDGQCQPILPPLLSETPFDFCENDFFVDDHINLFLLRLWLFDPMKYEYASPIIPLPDEFSSSQHLFEDEKDDGNKKSNFYKTTKPLIGPFFEMFNSKCSNRTIEDMIEMNYLLETLFLSYRNELGCSIDNNFSESEFSDFDDIESNEMIFEATNDRVEISQENSFRDSKESSDDENFMKAINSKNDYLTKPDLESISDLLDTGEPNNISARLERLAQIFDSDRDNTNPLEIDERSILEMRDDEVQSKIQNKIKSQHDLNEFFRFSSSNIYKNNQILRKKIASKLYPLLNSLQIQLLYKILKEKN
ncbi:hypothetical protein SSS_00345 [Sarcoptes scabiei]|uniref:Uncharacterized protein n=1 Tax=Sarcoptes scabiei TaxID=52283 RepID=A0A834VC62_SARSC|nr:hypothetical protein SSS_00345 [Sarcoptes scabiei]